jgi:AcrR family transcriptional regulator
MSSRAAAAETAAVLARPSRAEVILREASRLFAERGYQSTTINHIGEASGITGPGVYRHFGSKQEILMALIERSALAFADRAMRLLEQRGDRNDLLRQLVDLNVEWILADRELATAYWVEIRTFDASARARLADLEKCYLGVWQTALSHLRPELASDDADAIAEGIYWLMRSTALYDGDLDRDRFSLLLTRMALGALMADLREPRLPATRARGAQRDRIVQQPTPGAP